MEMPYIIINKNGESERLRGFGLTFVDINKILSFVRITNHEFDFSYFVEERQIEFKVSDIITIIKGFTPSDTVVQRFVSADGKCIFYSTIYNFFSQILNKYDKNSLFVRLEFK